jgi:DNA-binding SARP family transcriptional activator
VYVYLLQTLGAAALHPGSADDRTGEPILRGSKTLVLVAYLADRPERSASRAHLAELFWPGVPASKARRSLRQAL